MSTLCPLAIFQKSFSVLSENGPIENCMSENYPSFRLAENIAYEHDQSDPFSILQTFLVSI